MAHGNNNNNNQAENAEVKAAPVKTPKFTLERLRQDCFKLFNVTTSTFDGATLDLKGDKFTVEEIKNKIDNWKNKKINAKKEGGK